jgi:thiamine-monophosphate kinase
MDTILANIEFPLQTGPSLPSEFELVAKYFAPLARAFPGAYGLLDDAAVISPASGNELVVKTDTIVASVDFPPETAPDFIARKALRVNLSDLAAKGVVPRAYVLDLVLPATVDEGWIAKFAAGLERDQAEYGVHLIGGDMSSTPGPVTIAVCALGEAPIGRIVRRGGARADDIIFVTGTIGDAALGLTALRGALTELDDDSRRFLLDRYRLPQPRVTLGPGLIGVATAAIDISDGLIADLRHLCEVSRVDAIVEAKSVPLSPAARQAIARDPQRLPTALTGGDDYEVLFTAPPEAVERISELARSASTPITPIGRITRSLQGDRTHVVVLDDLGQATRFTAEGWTHFG